MEDDLTEKPIYHPLRESRFRLFALHPAFNNGSPISGDLQEFDINEHPNYYALSYVWGQEPQIHQIQINDKGVMIRPNLFQALQRLRERYRDQPRYVWIDSLCINQADLDEKSIQVGRMAEIYQKAKRVHIWLGEEDFVSNSAMTLVHQIAGGGFNWHSKWRETYKLTALDQFLGRPWFRRRWIVQEAAFSVRSIVICGGKSTPLDSLAYTVRLVRIRLSTGSSTTNTWSRNVPPNDIYPAFYDSPAMRLFALIDYVFQRSESGDIIGRRLHLETLVDMSTFCETSNQRDTIYALLSLAKEQEILSMSQPAYSLVVDYNKELIDVFAGFVLHCCHYSSSLDVICRPWAPGSTSRTLDSQTTPADRDFLSSLPSWIASKDQLPFGNPSLGLTQRLHGKHLVGRPPNPLESARRRGSSNSAEEQHGFEPPAPLGNNPKSSTPSHPEDSSSPLHRVRSRGGDEGRHDAPNGRTSTERGLEISPLHRAQVAATGRIRSEITPTITMLPQASTTQAIQARNRRKTARTLLAISDRLGAANPEAFDDSAFKRGPALDYPEYEGGKSAHRYTYEMKEVPFALDRVYNAHYNTKPDVFLGRNPETQACTGSLFTKGIMIGRITRRSVRMANAVIPAECFEVLDLSPRDQSDLWRILCADRDEEGKKAPPSFQAAFLERIAKSLFVREDGRLEPSTIGIDVEELLQGEGLSEDVKQYFAVVRDVIWNRRTFKAYPREGLGIGVIGLAPQDAKAGDDICILYGCSVPVVLRQHSENDGANSYWQLIGDAYVHNFMDGQGVQALPSDRSRAGEVLFEIR